MNSCNANPDFEHLAPPRDGTPCRTLNGKLIIPSNPVLCFIDGDGIGREIGPRSRSLIDAAVNKMYRGTRSISWLKLYAGDEALPLYDERLPNDTLRAVRHYRICLKGPLSTPVATGHSSLNVAIRQKLGLYASVRPFSHIAGVPSPVKHPERVDMILFRENTEDVYAGIEWPCGSAHSRELADFIVKASGRAVPRDAGIGIKIMSGTATKRLVRTAITYALDHHRRSITFVTKGNIMKCTEGAFRKWAYEVACDEFGDTIVTEEEYRDTAGKTVPGKLLVQDRLADDMLQQVLLYPERYDVIAAPNLNGDYLSDALAAQVGGIAMAPGANIGDQIAVFEPAHGTAPAIAGRNSANPTALILSGALMLEYMGWDDVAMVLRKAVAKTVASGLMTADLSLHARGITPLSTSEYVEAVKNNI